jgi:hypothetical protein
LDELKELTDDLHLITVGNADLTFLLFVGHSLTSVDKCQEHARGWWAFYTLAHQL